MLLITHHTYPNSNPITYTSFWVHKSNLALFVPTFSSLAVVEKQDDDGRSQINMKIFAPLPTGRIGQSEKIILLSKETIPNSEFWSAAMVTTPMLAGTPMTFAFSLIYRRSHILKAKAEYPWKSVMIVQDETIKKITLEHVEWWLIQSRSLVAWQDANRYLQFFLIYCQRRSVCELD